MSETLFRFKKFQVSQKFCAMKINTDGVLLGAWAEAPVSGHVLDVGTGSGVIAMMLAQRSKSVKILGIEIDEASYKEAKLNMGSCEWKERLTPIMGSIQDFSRETNEKFDLVVSNPPFFSGGTLSSTQEKTVVRHAVKLPHNELLRAAYRLLKETGDFSVILPHIEGLRFIELAEQYRFFLGRYTEVFSFPEAPVERLLLSFKKQLITVSKNQLFIRDETRAFSSAYRELTKAFYLKF